MGIKGLLPLLEPIQTAVQVSAFSGKRVAVDGHCWLHRGAFGCASDLILDNPTDVYVKYFMKMVSMLIYYGVIPIIVFDGQELPVKQLTNLERSRTRQAKYSKGMDYVVQGEMNEAKKHFQQAIDITPEMINAVIKELDRNGVEHIVAPFEADPQLAFLVNSGQAAAAITEDSDLLVFGCQKVIYKMDIGGHGQQINFKDVLESRKSVFKGLDEDAFRQVCILSGCDYSKSPAGFGLKTVLKIAKSCIGNPARLGRILRSKISPKEFGPFKIAVRLAETAFLFQWVFDKNTRTYRRYTDFIPRKLDDLTKLGKNPQNRNIPILRSNNTIFIDPIQDLKDANKENIDPCSSQQFDDLDENGLKQFEDLLDKYDSKANVTSANTTTVLGNRELNTATVLGKKRPNSSNIEREGNKRLCKSNPPKLLVQPQALNQAKVAQQRTHNTTTATSSARTTEVTDLDYNSYYMFYEDEEEEENDGYQVELTREQQDDLVQERLKAINKSMKACRDAAVQEWKEQEARDITGMYFPYDKYQIHL